MAPEYAMFGLYSEKSDVFSFGVIILEILSGRKNRSRHNQSQYADSLLTYVSYSNVFISLILFTNNLIRSSISLRIISAIYIPNVNKMVMFKKFRFTWWLSQAWNKWNEEKFLDILDSNLKEFESSNEMFKCIQIGLLCVQENPDARPSMATIISYISDDSIQLPFPQEPAFFLQGRNESNVEFENGESCSINEISKSEFFPR